MDISAYWMSILQDLINDGCSFTFKIKLPNGEIIGEDELTDMQEIKKTIGVGSMKIIENGVKPS